jgi:hypothetical protein
MIQLSGAAKRFGPKTLLENLDWLVTMKGASHKRGLYPARTVVGTDAKRVPQVMA